MKKSLKYILLLALLVLIFYYLQIIKTNKLVVNEVSLAEQNAMKTNKQKSSKSKELDKQKHDSSETIQHQNNKEPEERTVSYLTAYREFNQFKKCLRIYQARENGTDLINDYLQSFVKPDEIQVEYYKIHIEQCYSFLISEKESIRKAWKRLIKRIDDTTPETKEEIALSQALEIQDRINDISEKIRNEKSGNILLTEEDKKANLNKRIALSNEMMLIMQRNKGEMTEADRKLMLKIMDELEKIDTIDNYEPNEEEITNLQKEFLDVVFELKEFFSQNQTPDVFLIFADHLLNEQMGKFFFTDDLNNMLGIYDREYIIDLNKIIVPFIACTLDYPCGPESYLSIKHCTHPYGFGANSCGKSIEDYYLDDLIGPNQMIDFNNYFNYLLDNYAQK